MYDDAQNPNEYEEDVMGENIQVGNVETKSNGGIFQDNPPNFAATMISLRVEMRSYMEDNERLVRYHEEHNHSNVMYQFFHWVTMAKSHFPCS